MTNRPLIGSRGRSLLAMTALGTTLGAGFVAGRASTGAAGAVTTVSASPAIVVPDELQRADLVQPFDDFFQAYHLLTTNSYYAPITDHATLVYAAINGMLSTGTGDSHTLYISPTENTALQAEQSGSFEGIGAYVATTGRGITIIPLPGSPATKAGLRSGDLIVRINGQDAAALTESQSSSLLRGPAGTRVTLGVERTGVHGVFTVVVTRARITVPNVTAKMIGNSAYLRIGQFTLTTGADVTKALSGLLAHHPRGLVLDLRDNPGGYVDQAVVVNSDFLPAGQTVLLEENSAHQLDAPLISSGPGALGATTTSASTLPMTVLVNDGTASAAEITAGAMQDNARATVIGITTYGKGSVQEEHDFADNSSVRITTRLWLTPHKRLIQNHGITPDITIDSPVSDGSARDAQLARALRRLRTGG